MASWRERWTWWREFRQLGARDVKRRVDGVTWHQEKHREAERFLWWQTNGLTVLALCVATLGALAALLNLRQ
jgi:hypothetical protein